MEHPGVITAIEYVARALEIVGVAVIALAFVHAMIRGAVHFGQRKVDAYERLKVYIGKALLLGLEFLVAADIIRTVIIEPTKGGILALGLLIVVRIVLGWSIAVEIEGCWPWQVAERKVSGARCQLSEGGRQKPE
jgi:uncharacterized membrane protein